MILTAAPDTTVESLKDRCYTTDVWKDLKTYTLYKSGFKTYSNRYAWLEIQLNSEHTPVTT